MQQHRFWTIYANYYKLEYVTYEIYLSCSGKMSEGNPLCVSQNVSVWLSLATWLQDHTALNIFFVGSRLPFSQLLHVIEALHWKHLSDVVLILLGIYSYDVSTLLWQRHLYTFRPEAARLSRAQYDTNLNVIWTLALAYKRDQWPAWVSRYGCQSFSRAIDTCSKTASCWYTPTPTYAALIQWYTYMQYNASKWKCVQL